jgi:4'-phosphopantetheinyl transferase EntD
MPAFESAVGPSAPLSSLFPAGVVTMATRAEGDPADLSPAEAAHIRRARPVRAREFAAGRLCARLALQRLGRVGCDLPAGPDRNPLWPPGIVGSISHTTGYCCVALGERSHFRSIGLDVEVGRRVTPDLYAQFLTEPEQPRLREMPPGLADEHATLIFSAKEAFYKCQHPMTMEWLDFTDIEVDLPDDPGEAGRLSIRPTRRLDVERLIPAPWHGRFVFFDGLVATGFVLLEAGAP